MRCVVKLSLILLIALLVWSFLAGEQALHAQAPSSQQKYNEAIRSAQQTELLGYVLAGAGILLVVAGIPLAIYFDRKKKAHKRAARRATDGDRPDAG